MNLRLKLAAMYALDWLDVHVLRHRVRSVCNWIAWHSWWGPDDAP